MFEKCSFSLAFLKKYGIMMLRTDVREQLFANTSERKGRFLMLYNLSNVIMMGALTLIMVRRARYSTGRRMLYIPLMMTVMKVLFCNTLRPAAFPVLTVLLFVLRLTVILCCVGELKREAARTARRQRLRREARHSEHIGQVVPLPSRSVFTLSATVANPCKNIG